MSSEYTGFYFKNYEIKRCCHFLVNKCKIFKMLIETLFLRLFESDQSEIKEIVQEIVNIHNGTIFKNGTNGDIFIRKNTTSERIKITCKFDIDQLL